VHKTKRKSSEYSLQTKYVWNYDFRSQNDHTVFRMLSYAFTFLNSLDPCKNSVTYFYKWKNKDYLRDGLARARHILVAFSNFFTSPLI
jgi:hypothetical protein